MIIPLQYGTVGTVQGMKAPIFVAESYEHKDFVQERNYPSPAPHL